MARMSFGTSSIFSDLDVEITPDAPIGQQTWYGVGGRADMLVRPRTVDALTTLIGRCHRTGVPVRILGSGANLLIGDDGVDGIVIRLDQPTFRQARYEQVGDVTHLRLMGGIDLSPQLMDAARRGLEGLSHLAGIPASVGGAVRMNAGGAYGATGDTIDRVTCITRAGRRVTYPRDELVFDYRETNIPDPVIVSAVFRLTPEDPIQVRARVKEIFEFKKSTQPLADHSAGCAFRNPVDPVTETRVSAGRLIDEAGLKGLEHGGAMVSDRHANFIVARPGATASDVIALMETVRTRVFDACGLELENEIVVWRRGDMP